MTPTQHEIYLTFVLWSIAWAWTNIPFVTDWVDTTFWRIRNRFCHTRYRLPIDLAYELVSCHKCVSFWLILAVTQNPFLALIAAAITEKMDKKR
jgi:hypothetical protein